MFRAKMKMTHRLGEYVSSILTADELAARILLHVEEMVSAKVSDVDRGSETADLAGLQVQMYRNGVRDVLKALDLGNVATTVLADDLVAAVDPNWRANTQKRSVTPSANVPAGVSSRWREHAYPLRQLTVRVQGTRHHDNDALAAQVAIAAERLRAGETAGYRHDDDFGYSFELTESPDGPSFFDESCGAR